MRGPVSVPAGTGGRLALLGPRRAEKDTPDQRG